MVKPTLPPLSTSQLPAASTRQSPESQPMSPTTGVSTAQTAQRSTPSTPPSPLNQRYTTQALAPHLARQEKARSAAATTPGAMKKSAEDLLEAVKEQTGRNTAERASLIQRFHSEAVTQLASLKMHMPILEEEVRRQAILHTNIDPLLEKTNIFKGAASTLENVVEMLFDQIPDMSKQAEANLNDLEQRTDILLNELETKQFQSSLIVNAKSLLASVKNYAQSGSSDIEEGARLSRQFDTQLKSMQGHLTSLKQRVEECMTSTDSTTWRLLRAEEKSCNSALGFLKEAAEKLFDPGSEKSEQIKTALDGMEDRINVLLYDTEVNEFNAGLKSLQDNVGDLEATFEKNREIPETKKFWQMQHNQVKICEIRAGKLEDAIDELFGKDSEESKKIQDDLDRIEERTYILSNDLDKKIRDSQQNDHISEESSSNELEELQTTFRRMRVSTFGSVT